MGYGGQGEPNEGADYENQQQGSYFVPEPSDPGGDLRGRGRKKPEHHELASAGTTASRTGV